MALSKLDSSMVLNSDIMHTKVYVNVMSLNIATSSECFIMYSIHFSPDGSEVILRDVFNEFSTRYCLNKNPVFDGKDFMYSCGPLPFGKKFTGTIHLPGTPMGFKITVKEEMTIDINAIKEHYDSHFKTPYPADAIKMVDTVLRHSAAMSCLKHTMINYIADGSRQDILMPHSGKQVWSPNSHIIDKTFLFSWKPFMTFDVFRMLFKRPERLLDIYKKLVDENDDKSAHVFAQINKLLAGLEISFMVPNYARRMYTIKRLTVATIEDGFSAESNSLNTFLDYEFDGEKCAVYDHYLIKYGYIIKNRNYPLVEAYEGKKTFLPLELCWLKGKQHTRNGKQLEQFLHKETVLSLKSAKPLGTVAKVPVENKTRIITPKIVDPEGTKERMANEKKKIMDAFVKCFGADKFTKEFGLSASNQMEIVDAKILTPPNVDFGNNLIKKADDGRLLSLEDKFHTGCIIPKWAIVKAAKSDRLYPLIPKLKQNFKFFAKKYGITLGEQFITKSLPDKYNLSVEMLDRCFRDLNDHSVGFAVVIINDEGDIYQKVKDIGEYKYGILTQCINKTTALTKMSNQTYKNLLQKINIKMNGVNYVMHSRAKILERPCMIIGVTHTLLIGNPLSSSKSYVFPIVSSSDATGKKYDLKFHFSNQPYIDNFTSMMVLKLKHFYIETKSKPEHIIYYRSEVNENCYLKILQHEMPQLRAACLSLNKEYKPRMTCVIVKRAKNIKFFRHEDDTSNDDEENGFVPHGLVVDGGITDPRFAQFYLVCGRNLTGHKSWPTKYTVIHDDGGLTTLEDLQQLTFYLCHAASTGSGSLSKPAPLHYATLAATRARKSLNGSNDAQAMSMEAFKNSFEELLKENPLFFV